VVENEHHISELKLNQMFKLRKLTLQGRNRNHIKWLKGFHATEVYLKFLHFDDDYITLLSCLFESLFLEHVWIDFSTVSIENRLCVTMFIELFAARNITLHFDSRYFDPLAPTSFGFENPPFLARVNYLRAFIGTESGPVFSKSYPCLNINHSALTVQDYTRDDALYQVVLFS